MGGVVQSFRRHQRFFLIALILFLAQTILALAHVHAASSARHASAAANAHGLANEYPCDAPAAPGHDEHCPLCAAIGAASALVLPAPIAKPRVVPRPFFVAAHHSAKVDARDAESHYQPRAPPFRDVNPA
jgi:hypothetical protein